MAGVGIRLPSDPQAEMPGMNRGAPENRMPRPQHCPGQKPHPSANRHGPASIGHSINYLGSRGDLPRHGTVTLDDCLVQCAKVPWAVDGPKSTLTSGDTRSKLMHVLGREPCRAHSCRTIRGTLERVELTSEVASTGRGLITRTSLVRVQPPLPNTRTEAI